MEYSIHELPNAILDIVKDKKEYLIHINDLYNMLKDICPDLTIGSEDDNIKSFIKAVSKINDEYNFIFPIITNDSLYIIFSKLSGPALEKKYDGIIPTQLEINSYVDGLNSNVNHYEIIIDRMENQIIQKDNDIMKLKNKIYALESDLILANKIIHKHEEVKSVPNPYSLKYTLFVFLCGFILSAFLI